MWRLPYPRSPLPALARCQRAVVPVESRRKTRHHAVRYSHSTATAPNTHLAGETPIEQPRIVRREVSSHPSRPSRTSYVPSKFLNTALKVYRTPSYDLFDEDVQAAVFLARNRDPRLPIVTAQMILHLSPELHPDIRAALPRDSKWEQRLRKLQRQGFPHEDIFEWAQILLAETSDEMVQAFLAHSGHKPAFLMNYILNDKVSARDGSLMSSESLHGLIAYCRSWYDDVESSSGDEAPATSDKQVSGVKSWAPDVFTSIVGRLFSLSRRIQPRAVVDVADLVAVHLTSLATTCEVPELRYTRQCRIFNHAVKELSVPPLRNPYSSLRENWRGILRLLSLSSTLQKPLVMEGDSYRAIRQVLLSIRKDESERDTATTLKQTWPPHRIARHGIEEATPLEEYHSKTIKAGIMMQEAGYAKELFDLATDVLGGMAPDGSPTIQSRAIFPSRHASDHSVWAAQVRATRNPEEAWQAFKHPPAPDLKPNATVYQEVIHKILAKQVSSHHDNLPGDGRQTFPFDDLNFTAFEKARVRPPSMAKLTRWIVESGIPLEGHLLQTLIRHSPSLKEALKYVHQSALSTRQQTVVEHILRGHEIFDCPDAARRHRSISASDVHELPRRVVHATIDLLCRLQPNRTGKTPAQIWDGHLGRIRQAQRLAALTASDGYCAAWETITRALARPNIILGNHGSEEENSAQVLFASGQAMASAERHRALTAPLFDNFARTIRKDLETRLPSLVRLLSTDTAAVASSLADSQPQSSSHNSDKSALELFASPSRLPAPTQQPYFQDWHQLRDAPSLSLLLGAQSKLTALWQRLSVIKPAGNVGGERCWIIAAGPHMVNSYMRVLAFLGDFDEMADLVRWTARHAAAVSNNGETKDAVYLARAMCAFRAFAEPMLDAVVVSLLRAQVAETSAAQSQIQGRNAVDLYWPSDEEVEDYAEGDVWGNRQNLRTLLRLVRERRGGDGGGDHGMAKAQARAKERWRERVAHVFGAHRQRGEQQEMLEREGETDAPDERGIVPGRQSDKTGAWRQGFQGAARLGLC